MTPVDRTAIVRDLRRATAHIQLRTILTSMDVPPARIEAMMSELFAERAEDAARAVGKGEGVRSIHPGDIAHD